MFRRREDENSTDQGSLLASEENVNVMSGASSPSPAPASSYGSSSSQAGASGIPASPLNPIYGSASSARPANESSLGRPAMPSQATQTPFRAQPSPAEISRARMPEPKAPSSFGVGPQGAGLGAGLSSSSKDSRRVLTVGSDILLKGEIATCDRLVIEGKVDAVLNDVGTVELAESGSFKGVAQVENAEISGLFEGELVVKSRLVIYATGRVRGKITYGEIEIERGGELTGEIKTMSSAGQPVRSARSSEKAREEKVVAA